MPPPSKPSEAVPFDPTNWEAWLGPDALAVSDAYPSLAEACPSSEAGTAVVAALDHLAPSYRLAVEAVVLGGLNPAQAAELLGLGRSTLRKNLSRGLYDLHQIMVEAGHDMEEDDSVSKQKRQGTAYETAKVAQFHAHPLVCERLPEGGPADVADARVSSEAPPFYLEMKHRQRLVAHDALHKALAKAPTERAAVLWKRLVPVEGKARRQPVGQAEVALLPPPVLRSLLRCEALLYGLAPLLWEQAWDVPAEDDE